MMALATVGELKKWPLLVTVTVGDGPFFHDSNGKFGRDAIVSAAEASSAPKTRLSS
jgi:hypothetical protein